MFNNVKFEELKKKIINTLLLLIVYRFVAQVPVPGVDSQAIANYFAESGAGMFDLVNAFSGGAFKKFSIIALSIMPYITTSIIFSLLGEVVPQIQEMQEDQEGHKKIQKYTRYCAVLLACIQAWGMAAVFEGLKTKTGASLVVHPGFMFKFMTMVTLTTGTMFLLWLGERITEFGLENGVSLIIFTGIAVDLPMEFSNKVSLFRSGELALLPFVLAFVVLFVSLYVVAFVESAFRNIPIQFAKRVVGGAVYGGTQSLPLRLDTGGVMPPILASSLIMAPITLASFAEKSATLKPWAESIKVLMQPGSIVFNILFAMMIFYMAYFYAPIQFKPKKVSEMLQRNNAFIPGIRPGEKTEEYLKILLDRVTFFGALFLVVVCILPPIITGSHSRLEGTALLILVGVAMRVMINVQTFIYSDSYSAGAQQGTKTVTQRASRSRAPFRRF